MENHVEVEGRRLERSVDQTHQHVLALTQHVVLQVDLTVMVMRCESFVFSNPRPVATASGAKWQR